MTAKPQPYSAGVDSIASSHHDLQPTIGERLEGSIKEKPHAASPVGVRRSGSRAVGRHDRVLERLGVHNVERHDDDHRFGGGSPCREARRRDDPDGEGRRPREPVGSAWSRRSEDRAGSSSTRPRALGSTRAATTHRQHRRRVSPSAGSTTSTASASTRSPSSQYVTFLNTVDPEGRNEHELYLDNMSPTVWAQYGVDQLLERRGYGQALHGRLSGVGPEAVQSRRLPPRGALRQLADQRRRSLEEGRDVRRLHVRRLRGAALAGDREGHVRHGGGDADANRRRGIRRREQRRVDQGRVLRPQGWRDGVVLGVPDWPFDQPNVSVLDPATGDVTNADDQPLATYNPNDPTSTVDTPGAPPGAAPNWCPSQVGQKACKTVTPFNLPLTAGVRLQGRLPGEREHGRPGEDALPVGHVRHGRQRRRGPRHARAAASGLQLPAGVALLPRRCRQRAGVPGGDLGLRLLPTGSGLARVYPWLGFRLAVIGDIG